MFFQISYMLNPYMTYVITLDDYEIYEFLIWPILLDTNKKLQVQKTDGKTHAPAVSNGKANRWNPSIDGGCDGKICLVIPDVNNEAIIAGFQEFP